MKYLHSLKSFKIIKESNWLNNREKEWDQHFAKLIMCFHDSFKECIEELKDKFNDRDDPVEIKNVYKEKLENGFENLSLEISNVEDDEDLHKLWDEFKIGISLWKETFNKLSSKMDNYNFVFRVGHQILNQWNKYITPKISKEYYNCLDGEMDDKRHKVVEFFDNIKNDFFDRLDSLDVDLIFSQTSLEDVNSDEIDYNSGDEVRYKMENDDENTAIVSSNQENLIDNGKIRLASKSDGSQFEVDKSEIIEIIPKHKTINQEAKEKLKKVKDDPEKLKKLNTFLDQLNKEDNE